MDNKSGDFNNLIGINLDHYKIIELIKETGKSLVFKAKDLELKRYVALKILRPDQSLERQIQFSKEGERLANLEKHEYITTVYAAGQDKELHYIAMELVPGDDLEDIIRSGKTFSLEEIINIMTCITEAISYANSKGIDHNDIKLENIKERKGEESDFYVLDFGDRLNGDKNSNDLFGIGSVFSELLSNCNNKIPRKLEQIVETSLSSDGYETPEDIKDAIESYKRGITRRKFLKVAGSGLVLTSLGYSGYRYLDYRNSIDYIVDEISKVEATDYDNIDPLFKELLLRIIDHKIDWLVESGKIPKGKFPYATTENGSWFLTEGGYWSEGFWPGILWTAYEITGKEKYKAWASEWTNAIDFTEEESNDLRSIRFYHSHAKGYDITEDESFRYKPLRAAEFIASRFNEVGNFIETGEEIDTSLGNKRIHVDSVLPSSLLAWAFRETNNDRYSDIIFKHVDSMIRYSIREDGSTREIAEFDPRTGSLIQTDTYQGYNKDSTHSRGQAWLLYNFTLAYRLNSSNRDLLIATERVADYFIDNLPPDYIPLYDFDDPNKNIPKDSSSATIASSALLNLFNITGKEKYRESAYNILKSLSSRQYLSTDLEDYQGIIMHGCSRYVNSSYTNSSLIYGDYHYLDTLRKIS